MTHPFQTTEGIILRCIPFRDYDDILFLFTPDAGVIKLFYHGSRSKRRGVQGLCNPLTKVEVVYREKRGEIFQCQEMSLLESFSHLRKNIRHLEAGCDLLQVIYASQLAGKAAPALYALLCYYLNKIPQTAHLSTLAISFRLKLLTHEGLMTFPLICSECHLPLISTASISHADARCPSHAIANSCAWDQGDLETLYRLALSQSYREICQEELSTKLNLQATHFFEACLSG